LDGPADPVGVAAAAALATIAGYLEFTTLSVDYVIHAGTHKQRVATYTHDALRAIAVERPDRVATIALSVAREPFPVVHEVQDDATLRGAVESVQPGAIYIKAQVGERVKRVRVIVREPEYRLAARAIAENREVEIGGTLVLRPRIPLVTALRTIRILS